MHPAPHPAVLYTDTMLLFFSGENPAEDCNYGYKDSLLIGQAKVSDLHVYTSLGVCLIPIFLPTLKVQF